MSSFRENGYTLIELLVVIALLAGLSAVLLLNGAESRNLVQLQTSAQQLESALTQAQAYGNSGRAFPAGTDKFDSGFGVFVTTASPKNIRIYGGLGDANASGTFDEGEEKYTVATQNFELIKLGGNVEIGGIRGISPNANASEGHVLFRRGEAEAHIYTNNQTPDGLRITLASGSASIDVVINKAGLIYIDQ
ncbi:TPA: hypothetical protein DEP58_02050 [Patescibacteria group bacterium]|nr:MAG: hypothetical protein UU98_C0015G0014 [Parcubacteria group bacterium GW2011_GWD2_42_14]HCC05067.1 hypothetical protein [Patescibacteria group bacterium]